MIVLGTLVFGLFQSVLPRERVLDTGKEKVLEYSRGDYFSQWSKAVISLRKHARLFPQKLFHHITMGAESYGHSWGKINHYFQDKQPFIYLFIFLPVRKVMLAISRSV